MIKLFSYEPELFNNNGDQGNLEVLMVEIQAAGSKFAFTQDLASADFALFGDAAIAVMRQYGDQLEKLRETILSRYQNGQATLLVGSSYAFFAPELGLEAVSIPRYSGFVSDDDAFGYKNSDLDLPNLRRNGLFIGTSLFGPLLAKNPSLLSLLLAGLGVEVNLNPERLQWIEEIRKRSSAG